MIFFFPRCPNWEICNVKSADLEKGIVITKTTWELALGIVYTRLRLTYDFRPKSPQRNAYFIDSAMGSRINRKKMLFRSFAKRNTSQKDRKSERPSYAIPESSQENALQLVSLYYNLVPRTSHFASDRGEVLGTRLALLIKLTEISSDFLEKAQIAELLPIAQTSKSRVQE